MLYVLIFAIPTILAITNGDILQIFSSDRQIQVLQYQPNISVDGSLFKFSLNGFPYVRQNYNSNLSTSDFDFTFRLGILRLVEYNDQVTIDSSTSFCSFIDIQDQWYPFNRTDVSKDSFQTIEFTSTFFGSGDCEGLEINLSLVLTEENSNYNFKGKSTEIKYGEIHSFYTIKNYPFKLENSKLGFEMVIFSENERKFSGTEILINGENNTGSIIFDTIASIDGSEKKVSKSELKNSNGSAKAVNDDGSNSLESYNLVNILFDSVNPKEINWKFVQKIDFRNKSSANNLKNGFLILFILLLVI